MAGEKFLKNVGGVSAEAEALQESSGAPDAGRIPALRRRNNRDGIGCGHCCGECVQGARHNRHGGDRFSRVG